MRNKLIIILEMLLVTILLTQGLVSALVAIDDEDNDLPSVILPNCSNHLTPSPQPLGASTNDEDDDLPPVILPSIPALGITGNDGMMSFGPFIEDSQIYGYGGGGQYRPPNDWLPPNNNYNGGSGPSWENDWGPEASTTMIPGIMGGLGGKTWAGKKGEAPPQIPPFSGNYDFRKNQIDNALKTFKDSDNVALLEFNITNTNKPIEQVYFYISNSYANAGLGNNKLYYRGYVLTAGSSIPTCVTGSTPVNTPMTVNLKKFFSYPYFGVPLSKTYISFNVPTYNRINTFWLPWQFPSGLTVFTSAVLYGTTYIHHSNSPFPSSPSSSHPPPPE